MKLRIGDKVKFLNEKGEGVVTRIQDNTTVFVEISDGFEIPYLASQLVPIHTELILDKGTDNIEMDPDSSLNELLYFIIETDHELSALRSDYKLYLFNSSSYQILYTYSIKDGEYYQTLKHGTLGPYQKVLFKQVKMPFFQEFLHHRIDAIFYKNTLFKPQLPVSETIFISQKALYDGETIEHSEFKFPVYAFLLKDDFSQIKKVNADLTKDDVKRLMSIKEFKSSSKKSHTKKDYLKSLEKEVDLHAEELLDNLSGMSNHEILSIQLEKFEKELDDAIDKGFKKIIFIHGVGNGRLKSEIHSVLKSMKEVTFQDASFKKYGYGATQVNIHG
ncbi:MAG: DUF2027 domain-containing protein [Bacteroidia bacterium]